MVFSSSRITCLFCEGAQNAGNNSLVVAKETSPEV